MDYRGYFYKRTKKVKESYMKRTEFKPTYVFTKNPDLDNRFDNFKVSISAEINTLDELLEVFEQFIKAAGYAPKGRLEFVSEDYKENKELPQL